MHPGSLPALIKCLTPFSVSPLLSPKTVLYCYNIVVPSRRTHMVKRLTKHGNSLALVIDRGVLDLLDIDADTPLTITTDGNCLVVAPIRDPVRHKKFRAALESVIRKNGRALNRFAERVGTPY